MSEHELMQALGDILDQLGALPDDAFSERWALKGRQGELRAELALLQAGRLAEQKQEWDNQAAKKPSSGSPDFVSPISGNEGLAGGLGGGGGI
jgi:hypothetical protein